MCTFFVEICEVGCWIVLWASMFYWFANKIINLYDAFTPTNFNINV